MTAITALLRSTPPAWAGLIAKYGPAWILVAYLVHFLTTGIGADVRGARAEHHELAFYLRQICVAVNRDVSPNAWQQCQPPAR